MLRPDCEGRQNFHSSTLFRNLTPLTLLLAVSCYSGGDADGRRHVVIGLNPSERSENVARNARILDSLIEKRTGLDVEIFIAHDYSGLVEAMRGGTVDFAFFAPVSYVFAERIAGAQVLLKSERKGHGFYYGCVIVNRDSGYRTVEDLRGRDIAWVDPTSASGHIFPKAELVERGVDPESFFGKQTFAGGHDAVLLSVVNGTVTAGATYANDTLGIDGSWTQLADGAFRERVRPVLYSRPIPGDNLAASRRAMDRMPAVVERIKRGVMAITDDAAGRNLMQDLYHVDAMIPAISADYDPVRNAAELLDLDIAGRIAAGEHGAAKARMIRERESSNSIISLIVAAVAGVIGLATLAVATLRDRRNRRSARGAISPASATSASQVAVSSLVVEYPRNGKLPLVALNGVDLTIEQGEFVAVIGLSGSGKSTLLRSLNGTIRPASGTVWFEGHDVSRAAPVELATTRRKIGFIFQQFNLVKSLSATTNVLTGMLGHRRGLSALLGRFSREDRRVATDLLQEVGLAEHADQRVDRLSGGQQQRVAIARALAQEPTALLADEPMASLDPRLSEVVLDILKRINRERGITVVVNLHVLELARKYADRIVALRDGQIVYDGRPDELKGTTIADVYG